MTQDSVRVVTASNALQCHREFCASHQYVALWRITSWLRRYISPLAVFQKCDVVAAVFLRVPLEVQNEFVALGCRADLCGCVVWPQHIWMGSAVVQQVHDDNSNTQLLFLDYTLLFWPTGLTNTVSWHGTS
ncbi:hypothetical protein ABBQ32_009135 [Trebouxia sp. C0010 RCD-2024]